MPKLQLIHLRVQENQIVAEVEVLGNMNQINISEAELIDYIKAQGRSEYLTQLKEDVCAMACTKAGLSAVGM